MLIPVSQWIYNRYLVTYWIGKPEEGGKPFSSRELVATGDPNSYIEDEEWWPNKECDYYTWETIAENVPGPKVIGNIHGIPIHETGWDITTNKRL